MYALALLLLASVDKLKYAAGGEKSPVQDRKKLIPVWFFLQIELTKEFTPELDDFTKELEEISEGQSRVYLVYAK